VQLIAALRALVPKPSAFACLNEEDKGKAIVEWKKERSTIFLMFLVIELAAGPKKP